MHTTPDAVALALAERGPAHSGSHRVLLVEDSIEYASLVGHLLDEAGESLDVVHATRLATAGARLYAEEIDCVLLDLTLPDAVGLTGVRHIRRIAPHVPVVVLTNIEDDGLAMEAVQEGAQDYLTKARSDGHVIGRAVRYAIERKQAELSLAHQATHDALTGLPNRELFVERLDQAVSRARRSGHAVWVLFVDLDGFKHVNDSLGHDAGDRLLVEVAHRLTESLRPEDTVARFGGDEFVVLCEDPAGAEEAATIAARLGDAVSLSFHVDDRTLYVTPSVGITSSSGADERTAHDLLREADAAMYRAKERSGFCFEVFDAHMHDSAVRRLQVHSDLHRALRCDEFELHYQPQVCLETGRLAGVEALLRWRHAERGLIGPDEFVPVAEAVGLIVELGEWVILEACHQARRWGLEPGDGRTISINASGRQLADGVLERQLLRALDETGIDPRVLTIELTETGLLHTGPEAQGLLRRLRALGVRLSLDDFGTGYASLSVLAELPADEVKIDRGFVAGVAGGRHAHHIVTAVAALARSLDLVCVAEGVSEPEQVHALRAVGCDTAQGYLFGRPEHPDALGHLWASDRDLVGML